MERGEMHYLIGIVYLYDGSIEVGDFEIKVQGSTLTRIVYNKHTDTLQFFAGDMENDKYAEEVFPNEEELKEIYVKIVDNY